MTISSYLVVVTLLLIRTFISNMAYKGIKTMRYLISKHVHMLVTLHHIAAPC